MGHGCEREISGHSTVGSGSLLGLRSRLTANESRCKMNTKGITRRSFIRNTAVTAVAVLAVPSPASVAETKARSVNPLPRWRGFNLTDFTSPSPGNRRGTTDDELKWIV